jgi:hypothetical protein
MKKPRCLGGYGEVIIAMSQGLAHEALVLHRCKFSGKHKGRCQCVCGMDWIKRVPVPQGPRLPFPDETVTIRTPRP